MVYERFALIKERMNELIKECKYDNKVKEPFRSYFEEVASFLIVVLNLAEKNSHQKLADYLKALKEKSVEELMRDNHALFAAQTKEHYAVSFLNPAYAAGRLGEEYGRLLSFLYTEMYAALPYAYEVMERKEDSLEQIVIRVELFVEIYVAFYQAGEDSGELQLPAYHEVKDTVYWFVSDYAEPLMERRLAARLDPVGCYAMQILKEADFTTPHYLFAFGEYISDNQIKTAEYLAARSDEKIARMADTYTEGYRIGFIKGNKDLSKKKVVQIVYPLGFERMIRRAVSNFAQMGLSPTIPRTPHSIFHKRGMSIGGYYSDSPNKQFGFDHREDEALFLDKKLINRRLEIVRESYEHRKWQASGYAGPAWVEVFGEKTFDPVIKKEALRLSPGQQELARAYLARQSGIVNEYIKGEERSFTIIAFPIPEIGPKYEQIMDRTIALNTLDYELYERIQQIIIDALDQAEYVEVHGQGKNETNMKVMLRPLEDPQKQTKFENCVADVNIPVGEVFTSPQLAGTNGLLHVSSVYLNGLEFCDLKLTFEDGRIVSYGCGNFDEESKNLAYIRENILYHHDTLPIGEFAIGTNTTAYVMGREFGISGKLPILIAEKTGPHFAVGDTCYSHAEDIAVYNVDGKEVIARDNEISILRKTDPEKAYFQCHTDITIPFDELGALYGVTKDGKRCMIIENGRFVLEGCEELNEPLERFALHSEAGLDIDAKI